MMWHALIYPHAELGGKFRSKSWAGMHVLDIAGVVVCGGRAARLLCNLLDLGCTSLGRWISAAPALVAGASKSGRWHAAGSSQQWPWGLAKL